MRKNAGHVFQHMLWRGLYFFSILILNIWIARYFAAEKSGQIFFIVNNLALVLLIVSISLESGTTYYIASGHLDGALMANFCFVWSFVASAVAIVVWGSILYISQSAYLQSPFFLVSSFLFILGVLLTTYFTSLFYAKKEFGFPNKMLFFINILLLIFLISGRNHSIVRSHFITFYFSSFFLQGVILSFFFFRKYPGGRFWLFPSRARLKITIRYSLIALSANLVYFLVNRIDYWFVEYYCSGKELGNYIQASKLSQMLFILPSILGSTLFPIFSSPKNSDAASQLTISIRILLWINLCVCFLILFTGWFFLPFLFGPSFHMMYSLFILLIPGILSVTINYPLGAWFSSANRVRVNLKGSVLALAVICIADVLILPYAGIIAAPIISSAGYFSYCCFNLFVYRRDFHTSWREIFFIRMSDLSRIRQSFAFKKEEFSPEDSFIQNSTT